jgi:hypothetical protein
MQVLLEVEDCNFIGKNEMTWARYTHMSRDQFK